MAYISTEEVKAIREQIKKAYPSYKFSITRKHSSSVKVVLLKSDLDFEADFLPREYDGRNLKEENLKRLEDSYINVSEYSLEREYQGKTLEVFKNLFKIIKGQGWYDNSDVMTDYFDTAYYADLYIGGYEKKYEPLVA